MEKEEKTLTELKAIVYDLLVKQQDINRELQIANQSIAQKEVKTENGTNIQKLI